VGGEIRIHSQRIKGTRIEVMVPMTPEVEMAQVKEMRRATVHGLHR